MAKPHLETANSLRASVRPAPSTVADTETASGQGETPCPFPDELPAYIKDRYRVLTLVTGSAQVERLDAEDDDILIVCCDWLLWHRLIADGRHAVHYELGILEWDEEDSLNTDLFNHANDWILDHDGEDPTMFRNVSLGRLFGAEMSMAVMNYHRLNRSLQSLIRRFRPSEIWFFDFKYDINHISPALRRRVVVAIARDCGIGFVDRGDGTPADDHGDAKAVYRHKGHGRLALGLLAVYAFALETATRVRRIGASPTKRVLVLVNSNMAEPLVRGYSGSPMTPLFLGRTIPRSPGLLWRCLRFGIGLVNPWKKTLSASDRSRVSEIRDAVDELTSGAQGSARGFAYAYVRENILDETVLRETAGDVRTAESLLDRYGPARIVVDSVRSRRHLSYIELARARGIAVDFIWHAPMTPQNLKLGALGGDPRQPVFVDRCLSWGKTNEKWLRRVDATQPMIRVGSPLRNKFVNSGASPSPTRNRVGAERHVLLLQYGFNVSDLAGVNANMYGTFVNAVRTLRRLGYANVRLKMHPGPGRWKKSYFERIAERFDLDCPILMSEPFDQCLRWADVVIGPSHTGAMFETLAAGKLYHALILPPHNTFDLRYFERFPVLTSLDELPDALQRDTEAQSRRLLDDLYSTESIPDPVGRIWEVLENDVS